MATVMIADFTGMLPIRDPLLLADSNAQYAENCWLYIGQIRGFRHSPSVYDLKYADTKDVYRIPTTAANPPTFGPADSLWMEFPDPFMAAVRNPTVGDTHNRYYFFPSDQYASQGNNPTWPTTSPGPMYGVFDSLPSVPTLLKLGVPEPTSTPGVAPAATQFNLTTVAATPLGNNVLHFAAGAASGVVAGMTVIDATDTKVNHNTTADTPTGTSTSNVLTFADTTGVLVGMTVSNLTAPSTIPSGVTVTATTSTTVTMSQAVVGAGVGHPHYIVFENISIPPNAVVQSVDAAHTNVTLNYDAYGAGVLSGDSIQFTGIPETRAYVYTWVSAYDEGSAPSPATVATGTTTGTWTITIPAAPSSATTGRNLAKTRIYRTVTDSSGNTTYYQCVELTGVGAQTYNDSHVASDITANKTLDTINFTPPPADLQGVVLMANGIAAGFSNKREIWFSAAYQLHAWPSSYALAVEYPIVGLTADGASLNIITEGPPYIASGVTPDTITMGKITAFEPCVSRGSIVAAGEGGYYASPNGVQLVNSSGTTNVTLGIMEKEFFNRMLPPKWAAAKYGMSYIAFIKGQNIPATPESDGDENGLVFDQTDKNVPFTFINAMTPVLNAYPDELSGQVFYLTGNTGMGGAYGSVLQWNPPVGSPGTTTLWAWKWKSKKFRFTYPQQFMAFTVLFNIPDEVSVTPGVRDTTPAPNMAFDQSKQLLIVRIFADGVEICDREVQRSGEVLMIQNGSKWTVWEVQMEGQVEVVFFKMSSAVKELKTA